MADVKFEDLDLYNLLGITINATTSEVKKAYRKKALSCHPDKNPDNPKAAELFHQLSKALEILIDESARAAYDKVLKGKEAAKLRHQQLDSRRKKFKDELEARERAAQEASVTKSSAPRTDEQKLQTEIERLRKEGSRLVEEEINYVQNLIEEEKKMKLNKFDVQENDGMRLKIKWNTKKDEDVNGGYNYDVLHKILSKYGNITVLIISPKKRGSALVEFETPHSALTAMQEEKGLESNPFIITWLNQTQSGNCNAGPKLSDSDRIFPSVKEGKMKAGTCSNSYSFSSVHGKATNSLADNDFENLVLRKMRQAQERKDLEARLKEEEKID